jgi:hypothetical protein
MLTHDYSYFADEVCSLNNDFNERFQEFKSQETSLSLLSAPFNIEVDNVPQKFQTELPEHVKTQFTSIFFSRLLQITAQISIPIVRVYYKENLFGSTYRCE